MTIQTASVGVIGAYHLSFVSSFATTNPVYKKIKILHLIKSLGRGGAEKLIPETALVHNQDRFEFYCIYFFHQEDYIIDELERAGIQVHLIPSKNLALFFQIQKVREFIKEHSIDIIHAHLPWAGILSRFVGRDIKIPIVYTEHNTWDRYNIVSYWGNRLTFKHQDVAIAVSNEVALSMQLNSIFDPYRRGGRLKVKVIQNGVNTKVFKRETDVGRRETESDGRKMEVGSWESEEVIVAGHLENPDSDREQDLNPPLQRGGGGIGALQRGVKMIDLKNQLHIPSTSPVIGKVAVFRSQKRLWIWVDVALKILERCPETHFLLVGDGDWRERIIAQIERSGKQKNFHWVGLQKEVIPYLSIMDIYLSTSEFEGLPIAMLEAMSCEVPVVATSAGGIGEMVQHGVQGFLTGIDAYEGLVDFAVQLLEDPELHSQFAKAARARVVEKFSMNRMVRELEGVYDSVIARHCACPPRREDCMLSVIARINRKHAFTGYMLIRSNLFDGSRLLQSG
jgi:glycosyltransferase involved in cell wall biosynthesis